MQKIQILYKENASFDVLSKPDGEFLMVGRIPCVGEFIRASDEKCYEVVGILHDICSETGTVASVLLNKGG